MEALFSSLLIIHVISGFTALLSGVVPMIAKKGAYWHNLFGRIYFWAMFSVFVTSVPMSIISGSIFLFTIAIFSFYFVLTGYRFSLRKGFHLLHEFDHWVMRITLLTSLGMLAFAGYLMWNASNQAWIVLAVFGTISLLISGQDLRKFGKKGERNHWVSEHLNRMGGGYIATFTAFTVTNLTFIPGIIGWLAPTLIGTIILVIATKRVKKQFNIG